MDTVILLAGFCGGWLLVAGPIFQAILELKDVDVSRERIQAVGATITPPPKVSNWWWLLPPVKLYLERRRSSQFRHTYFHAMNPADMEAMLNFGNKATGWLFVATGGFLIATKETYEVSEHFNWGLGTFFAVIVVLLAASISYTALRVRRTDAIIANKQN